VWHGRVDERPEAVTQQPGADAAEVLAAIGEPQPVRALKWALPVVGYDAGASLDAALAAGFAPVGEIAVWVR